MSTFRDRMAGSAAAWFQAGGTSAVTASVLASPVVQSGNETLAWVWVGFALFSFLTVGVVQHCLTTLHGSRQVPQLGVFLGAVAVFGQLWRSIVETPRPVSVVAFLLAAAVLLFLANGIDYRLRQPAVLPARTPHRV